MLSRRRAISAARGRENSRDRAPHLSQPRSRCRSVGVAIVIVGRCTRTVHSEVQTEEVLRRDRLVHLTQRGLCSRGQNSSEGPSP